MPYSINELKQPEVIHSGRDILIECSNSTRKITPAGGGSSVLTIMILYLIYKYLESGLNEPLSFNLIISNKLELSPVVYNSMERLAQDRYLTLINSLINKDSNPKHYASAIVFGLVDSRFLASGSNAYMESGIGTPSSIAELVAKILHISSNDYVADICCGKGDFLVKVASENSDIRFDGYEINIPVIAIATIRAEILGVKAQFIMGDAIYNLSDNDKKYDKIFSNFPFGQRSRGEEIITNKPHLKKVRYYDWVFIDAICNHLSDHGKAVAVVSNGMLWNTLEKSAREYYINSGEIEAVIKLPRRLFSPYTAAPTSILVLSKNNESVRFIDAGKIISRSYDGIYDSRLSEEDIDQILEALRTDSDISITIDKKTIMENDYSLDIRVYNSVRTTYKNGVKLKDVADIVRGVDDIRSDYGEITTETGLQVLRLADISDSIVPQKLTRLEDRDFSSKYITLQEGDIILSRNPNPVKVALYNGDSSRRVVPSGNLYVIRCDKNKIKPSYLASFFLSKEGKIALDNIATGSFIRTIGMGSLENLTIPLADKEQQRIIEIEICRTQQELCEIKSRLDYLQHKLQSIYNQVEDK